jgi:hypothetical protein
VELPSVAGIKVAGASGCAETTIPGGVKTGFVDVSSVVGVSSIVGEGRGDALRSDICEAGMGGVMFKASGVLVWPLSVTAEWRECERVRFVGGGLSVVVRLRLGSVAVSVAPSTAGCVVAVDAGF